MSTALATLRTNVQRDLGNPSTDALSTADIDARINDSYYELLTRYRHPEIETSVTLATVDGTQEYSLESDYWYTHILRDETNNRLIYYRPLEWLLEHDIDSEGQPMYWTRWGDERLLYPTPDGAYSITEYYYMRADLLAGSGKTVFDGLEWDEILKWGAVWRCFQALGMQDQMIHTRNIWRTLVNSIPESEMLEAEKSFQVIPPLYANASNAPA